MTEPRGRMFEDFTKLMSDAAGVAHGMRKEAESMMKAQAEKFLATMDVVSREEFEAAKAMAVKAREENERLEKKIADLEAKLTAMATQPAQTAPSPAATIQPSSGYGGEGDNQPM
jgi:BMFP domain-containing protein YqiC